MDSSDPEKGSTAVVSLRRTDTGVQWGFRMQGGNEFGMPLFIQKVNPRSVSGRAGLRVGDIIYRINDTPVNNVSHNQAKMEIIRAGNEVDFYVQRGMIEVPKQQTGSVNSAQRTAAAARSSPSHRPRPARAGPPHSQGSAPTYDQQHQHGMRGAVGGDSGAVSSPSTYRAPTNVKAQSRSFKILEMSLEDAAQGTDSRPESVFDGTGAPPAAAAVANGNFIQAEEHHTGSAAAGDIASAAASTLNSTQPQYQPVEPSTLPTPAAPVADVSDIF